MRGARPQGGPHSELRPPNLYYDHKNARQTFHPRVGLQKANGYIPIQGRLVGPQPHNNKRQGLPNDSGPSNSQDVRFIDVPTDLHPDEYFLLQLAPGEEDNQWPPNANVITHEFRGLDERASQEAHALAVTTGAMRGNLQAEGELEGQEEYTSEEAPHLSELERVARTA